MDHKRDALASSSSSKTTPPSVLLSPVTPKASTSHLPILSTLIPQTFSAMDTFVPSESSTAPASPNLGTPIQYVSIKNTSNKAILNPNLIHNVAPLSSPTDPNISVVNSESQTNGLGISSEGIAATPNSNQAASSTAPAASHISSNTKEAWKKRKQVLLAETQDHTVANLHLHGLRPPPNAYQPFYQNSSILGPHTGQPAGIASASGPSHQAAAAAANHATFASTRTAILRPDDPNLRNDIIRMIDQWLADEGFGATRQVLMDEAGIKKRERDEVGIEARKLRTCLLEGDWPEVDKLLSKPLVKNHKAFLYAVYKQQFLEHIEHREFQKGFTFLNKRLKPLEHYQPHPSEFRDLCYLLSAKAVTDAPSFASWEGIQPARERLVTDFAAMLEQDRMEREAGLPGSGVTNVGVGLPTGGAVSVSAASGSGRNDGSGGGSSDPVVLEDGTSNDINGTKSAAAAASGTLANSNGYVYVPPNRLLTMLQQAVAYQVEFARYHPKKAPVVSSLLHDYTGFIVPNAVMHTMRGHRKNVKSVRFVGEEGRKLVSGSSDNTVRIWDSNTGRCDAVLEGHRSRIWDVDSTRSASFVASASGDSTVRVWGTDDGQCRTTLRGGVGDVYSCRFHPDERHLVSAGYDKRVCMYDIETGSIVKTFTGHQLGVSSAIFNPLGNLIVTASKDTTIRFWDVVSGLCIRTITGHLGEVTSVEINESGSLLLSSSKDNSNRLWDIRMLRPLKRFKGHQNTSKNFISASFAHTSLLVGGSEDGLIYMWDQESSEVLQTLEGHGFDDTSLTNDQAATGLSLISTNNNVAYGAVWNKAQSLLASCGDDGTVKTWIWDEGRDQEAVADMIKREHENESS